MTTNSPLDIAAGKLSERTCRMSNFDVKIGFEIKKACVFGGITLLEYMENLIKAKSMTVGELVRKAAEFCGE